MQNPVEWGVRDALKRILYFTSSFQSPLSRPWIITLLSSFFLPAKLKHPLKLAVLFLISLSRSFSTALTQLSFISLARAWNSGCPTDRLEPEIGGAWGLVPEKTLGCWGAALGFCPGWGSQCGQGPSRTRALRCPVPGGGDARAPRQQSGGGGAL